jgi:hypothetical protein
MKKLLIGLLALASVSSFSQETLQIDGIYGGVLENSKTGDRIVAKCSSEYSCSSFYFFLAKKENDKIALSRLNKYPFSGNFRSDRDAYLLEEINFGQYAPSSDGWLFNLTQEGWGMVDGSYSIGEGVAKGFGFFALSPVLVTADIVSTVVIDSAMIVSWPIRKLVGNIKNSKADKMSKQLIVVTKNDGTIQKIKNRNFKRLIRKIKKH